MGESHTIFKMVLVLGVVFLLVGALSPGADAAWTAFSNTLSNFPTFDNPFAAKSFTFSARANGTADPVNSRGVAPEPPNCDFFEGDPGTNQWWGCINKLDQNASYLTTGFGSDYNTSVFLDAFPDASRSYVLLTITINYQCAGDGTNIPFFDFRPASGGPQLFSFHDLTIDDPPKPCPDDYNAGMGGFQLQTWSNLSTTTSKEETGGTLMSLFFTSGAELSWEPAGGTDTDLFLMSYVSVTVTYQVTSTCSSADTLIYIGCILTVVIFFVVDVFLFFIEIIGFTGEIIFWFLSLISTFITLFGYFFAIPGAPPIIQGLITVIFIAIIAFIAFAVMKVVRGTGATG